MAELFQDLVGDPDYQSLTPDEQRMVRQVYFDKTVAVDAEYQALDKASQIEVKSKIFNHKPAEQPTLAVAEKLGQWWNGGGGKHPTTGKPTIQNPDGSVSTERTITAEFDGRHYLIPTIIDGKQVSAEEAVKKFRAGTNKPVGAYGTPEEAEREAKARTNRLGQEMKSPPSSAFNIPIPHVANEWMTRTGRRMHKAGEDLAKLPAAAKRLATAKMDKDVAESGIDVLNAAASGFNFASAPIDAAGEVAARGGLGLEEETARTVGDFTSAALGVPAAKLANAGKLTSMGRTANEVMLVGEQGKAPGGVLDPGEVPVNQAKTTKNATEIVIETRAKNIFAKDLADGNRPTAHDIENANSLWGKMSDELKANYFEKARGGYQPTAKTVQPAEAAGETAAQAPASSAQTPPVGETVAERVAKAEAENLRLRGEVEGAHQPTVAPVPKAPDDPLALVKGALAKQAAGKPLTILERDALSKYSPGSATAKPLVGKLEDRLQARARVKEFDAKNQEIVDDAKMILDDPNSSEYARGAAQEKLAELGVNYEAVKVAEDLGIKAEPPVVSRETPDPPRRVIDTDTLEVTKFQRSGIPQKLELTPGANADSGMPAAKSDEEMLARIAALEKQNEQLAGKLRPKVEAPGPIGRQTLDDAELAVSTFIERNGKINIPKNLREEFGAWARKLHDPEGLGVDEMAEELAARGIIPEGTTNALIDGLKSGRKSAIASQTAADDIAVKLAVDQKIQELSEAVGEISYGGKSYVKAYPAGDGTLKLVSADGSEKILRKTGDILRTDEVVPFDVPATYAPKSIRPAIKVGEEVYIGEAGARHDSIDLNSLPEGWEKQPIEKGWMGANGEFLDEAAMQRKLFEDEAAAMDDVAELGMPDLRMRSEDIPQSIDPLQHNYVPPAGGAPIDLVRRGDIIRAISEGLDLPIRKGHANLRGKRGIFKVREEVVRLKHGEDMGAVTHEAGHFISKKFFPGLNPGTDPELTALGRALYGARQPAGGYGEEGLAEFVRLYVTDATAAQNQAPNFFNHFETVLNTQHMDLRDVLRTARDDWTRWQNQPATAHVLAQMSIGEKSRRARTLSDVYTHTINDLNGIEEIVKRMTNGRQLDVQDDPGKLAQLFRGWMGKADLFFHYGTRDFGTLAKNGDGLNSVLKPIEGDLNNFRAYLVVRRAIELETKGKLAGALDINKVRDSFQELDSPAFRAAADGIYAYQDRLLTYLKDAGFLSDASYLKIKELNQNYVPWHRLIEDGERAGPKQSGKTFAKLWQPVKTLHGSDLAILDPIESIVKNTYSFINLAERNRVGQALVRLADGTQGAGKFVERLPMDTKSIKFNINEVRKQILDTLDQAGVAVPRNAAGEVDRHILRQFEQMAPIFRPKGVLGENILSVWKDGKQEYFQVHPDLYKGMMNLDRESSNWMVKILAAPARLLRVGATVFSTSFAARNVPRDQWSAMVYSKYGFIPGVDYLRGIHHVIKGKFGKGDEIYEAWKASGGEHAAMVSIDRMNLQDHLGEMVGNSGWKGKVKYVINHPVDTVRIFAELSEAGTRVGEFAKGLKKEGGGLEGMLRAGFASREVTLDFARRGAYMQTLNQISAFLNPNIQDWDKLYRTMFRKDSAGAWAKVVGGITVPSIALYLLNKDDPRYEELPAWQKNLFWIIPRGTMDRETWASMSPDQKAAFSKENWVWRIPKPFTLGLLFGTIPEQMLEYYNKRDPKALEDMKWQLLGGLPNPMPTAATPLIENYANYSMFRDRPLVPRGKQDAAGKEQFGAYTSETAKFLGRAAETVGVRGGYSPSKIENVFQGYGGTGGRGVLGLTDRTFFRDQMKEKPGGGFLSDASEAVGYRANFPGQPQSVQRFYEQYDQSKEIKATFDLYKRQGRTQDMRELLLKNRDMIREEKRMRSTAEVLGKLQKQADRIISSHLTGEEKQAKLNAITFRMADLAKRATRKPKVEAPQ